LDKATTIPADSPGTSPDAPAGLQLRFEKSFVSCFSFKAACMKVLIQAAKVFTTLSAAN